MCHTNGKGLKFAKIVLRIHTVMPGDTDDELASMAKTRRCVFLFFTFPGGSSSAIARAHHFVSSSSSYDLASFKSAMTILLTSRQSVTSELLSVSGTTARNENSPVSPSLATYIIIIFFFLAF